MTATYEKFKDRHFIPEPDPNAVPIPTLKERCIAAIKRANTQAFPADIADELLGAILPLMWYSTGAKCAFGEVMTLAYLMHANRIMNSYTLPEGKP